MRTADGSIRKRQYSPTGIPYHVRVQRYNEEKHELLFNAAGYTREEFELKLKELVKKWRI